MSDDAEKKSAKWITVDGGEPGEAEFETETEARRDAVDSIAGGDNAIVYVCRVVAIYRRSTRIETEEVAS